MAKLSVEKQELLPKAVQDYAGRELFIGEICKKYGLDQGTIKRAAKRYGVPLRTQTDRAFIKYNSKRSFQKENGEWVKICRDCGKEQPTDQFCPDKDYADERTSVCYTCRNFLRRPRHAERYQNDPEYRKLCNIRSHKRYHANADEIEHRRKQARYNLTIEQFNGMLEEQRHKCAACGADSPGVKGRDWHIDHDHSCCPGNKCCGKCIRGLLCQPCNMILGLAKDDPQNLLGLIGYLEKYQEKRLKNSKDMARKAKQPRCFAEQATDCSPA